MIGGYNPYKKTKKKKNTNYKSKSNSRNLAGSKTIRKVFYAPEKSRFDYYNYINNLTNAKLNKYSSKSTVEWRGENQDDVEKKTFKQIIKQKLKSRIKSSRKRLSNRN
jgi:hypothetical protein